MERPHTTYTLNYSRFIVTLYTPPRAPQNGARKTRRLPPRTTLPHPPSALCTRTHTDGCTFYVLYDLPYCFYCSSTLYAPPAPARPSSRTHDSILWERAAHDLVTCTEHTFTLKSLESTHRTMASLCPMASVAARRAAATPARRTTRVALPRLYRPLPPAQSRAQTSPHLPCCHTSRANRRRRASRAAMDAQWRMEMGAPRRDQGWRAREWWARRPPSG